MKVILSLITILFLTACGEGIYGENKISISIPHANGTAVYQEYDLPSLTNCIFNVTDDWGRDLPYQSYGYACSYNEAGFVVKVTLEFYYTDSGSGYLIYKD